MPAMMMILQAATSADHAPPVTLTLPASAVVATCSPADGGDILVCGRRDAAGRYRLPPLDSARFAPRGHAETTLTGDLKGAAEVESREIAPGMTSNRIMLRLKLPF